MANILLYYTKEYMLRSTPDFVNDGGCSGLLEEAFKSKGHKVFLYTEEMGSLDTLPFKPDLVITRISVSGTETDYKNLESLEKEGALIINDGASSRLSVDKAIYYPFIQKHKVPVPEYVIIDRNAAIDECRKRILNFSEKYKFPLVAKAPLSQGRATVRVWSIEEALQFREQYKNYTILFQRYLELQGQDIRVFVLGTNVLLAYRRKAKRIEGIPEEKQEFRATVALGGSAELMQLSKEVEEMSLTVAKVMNLQIVGIDVLAPLDTKTNKYSYFVCDVNAAPAIHLKKSLGINVANAIAEYAEFVYLRSVVKL